MAEFDKPLELAPLPLAFYDRAVAEVAQALLGTYLVRATENSLTVGRVVETEAYLASGDPACHAARGPTPRNAAMFGPPGRAYIYAIHARWCFNIVTEPEQTPSAVLIRAIEPVLGIDSMQQRRGKTELLELARGPARLCQALAIDKSLNNWDLTLGDTLWLAAGEALLPQQIAISKRIGVTSAHELLLRFSERGNRFVSGKRIN